MMRPDNSNPEDDGERLKPGLDDEHGSLLDFLNDRRRVAKSLYQTLPRLVNLRLLDFLAFQLDRELISYNVIISALEKKGVLATLEISWYAGGDG